MGGGGCGGKFSPWDISQWVYFACSPEFAVENFAPTCCEPTFGWWWLLLFADALQLSPRGLLFLPDELLVCSSSGFQMLEHCRNVLLAFISFELGFQKKGGEITAQCMQKMDDCAKKGDTPQVHVFYWTRDFKERYNMPWTSSDANRAPSTSTQFSTPLLAVGYGRDCCLLFSIPAKNVASCRQSSQRNIAYSDEKRMITRSPITDSDGNISLFQLLWKGTQTYAQATVGQDILLNFAAGIFRTAA